MIVFKEQVVVKEGLVEVEWKEVECKDAENWKRMQWKFTMPDYHKPFSVLRYKLQMPFSLAKICCQYWVEPHGEIQTNETEDVWIQ